MEMEVHQQKAWDILTDLEKNSLYLQLSQGQSSWEAGEILGISHYKYLELKERSVKFFKMFSDFYEKHENLFRPQAPVEDRFKDYIEGCIEKRLPRIQAVKYSGDSSQVLTEVRRRVILRNMLRLKESRDNWDRDIYMMIQEYDRWSNSRILPRSIQQMSAYKRRNNKREKIYINYLHRIPEWKVKAIVDNFQFKPKVTKSYFITMISKDLFEDGYQVIKVKKEKDTVKKLTDLYIYVFENEKIADVFGYMVSTYSEKIKNSKLGIRFWQEYRDTIQFAVNYKEVNNIDFYSEKLDMAYNLPSRGKRSLKKRIENKGAQRSNPEIFYIE